MTPLEKNKDDEDITELLEEMQAWQHESAEIFLRFERDLILEQQVVIVTEERPA